MKDVSAIVQEITILHQGIMSSARKSVKDAIRIGQLLAEQKEQMEHGAFLPWVGTLPFNERTARRYMALSRFSYKTDSVSDLQEAYKLVETLEAQEQRKELARKQALIDEHKRTGEKPAGWDRSVDRERKRQAENDEIHEKITAHEQAADARKKESAEREAHSAMIGEASDRLIADMKKRDAFKRRIRVSQSGEADAFIDALMDYLDELESDSRRIEACQNIIKVCRNIAADLQREKADAHN